MERNSPCVSWLPILLQNPETRPLKFPSTPPPISTPTLWDRIKQQRSPILFILLAIIGLGSVFLWKSLNPPNALEHRLSIGEEGLMASQNNTAKIQGTKAFKKEDYQSAIAYFSPKYGTKSLKSREKRGFIGSRSNIRNPMNQYSALKQALKPHLGWHGARISFLALFLLALLKVKTVNLKELALGFEGLALVDSHYKRLQRFFSKFEIDYPQIARIVVHWLNIPQPWVLSIDRTNWTFGSHCYNILTVGIVHEGVAIPILWWMLKKKKGNSNSDERMRFIEEMLRIFPAAQIRCLCGDREFIGQAWIRYLLLEPILAFCLRIRATDLIEHNGKVLAAKVVFAHLPIGESQRLQGLCRVWGYSVSIEALRLPDNSLLIVIGHPDSTGLVPDYAQRWGIETLFGIFKTRGFCLESTHFTDPKRLRKLFALLTLALAWSLQTGLEIHHRHPISLKKHGRRAKSLFRLGFDHLRHLILHPSLPNFSLFLDSLHFLSCT